LRILLVVEAHPAVRSDEIIKTNTRQSAVLATG